MTHGKQLKDCMLRIIRAAKVVKDKAYSLDEDAHLQIETLVLLVEKGKELMDQLKPLQPDEGVQGVLLDLDSMEPVPGKVVLIPNGDTPSKEEDGE